MPLISRRTPKGRTTGIYGHWWNHGYTPYLRLVLKEKSYTLWWAGNPYRPGKIVESFENNAFTG